ncbi:MAG TPA: hypothetical protein VHT91_15435 [Kofleriaceae bacterium]|jgi:hypothetical protein|nr:hypothetical protein [Kofleriaceae bacterium]
MQLRFLQHKVGAGVLALAGALTPAAAHGEASVTAGPAGVRLDHPILVLESYVGQRPASADAVMAPLLDELEQRGFATRPASILELVGRGAPRPGVLDSDTTAAEITQRAESGYEAYTRGRFAEAEIALTRAIERIHRNPALLVLDTHNLDATFKILVALALSQAKRGDTGGSVATMTELIRTFHQRPISRVDYGPDAEQFYRAVARQVEALGRGELSISVASDQAVIFVDGQIRGLGKAALIDLIPGVYRVFIQIPATPGRQYEVEVTAGRHTVLRVDWELDSSLWLTDSWVGFGFATEAERARQAGYAGTLARRWSGGTPLAVVGMGQLAGKPAVTAQLYDATGRVVRGAGVLLGERGEAASVGVADPADEPRLRALARYLADGVPAAGVHVLHDGSAPGDGAPGSGPGEAGRAGGRLAPRVLVGAGAAALVAGSVLYAIDQDSAGPSSVYRNTAPAGIAVGAVGLAAVSVGLWLWGVRGGSSPRLAIGSSGGFIGWGGAL